MPMPFNNAVMTNGGAALLTKAQAGECKIEFTRMAIGDGTYDEDERTIAALQARTDLKDLKNSYAISGCSVYTEHSVKVTALLTNQDPTTLEPLVTEGYYINEVGLFAKEADGAESTEVLYSIAVTSGEQGDFMPPYNDYNPAQITQDFYVTVDNSAEVLVNSGGAALLVEDAQGFMIGAMPFYYGREYLPEADKTTITILKNTQVNINGKGYYNAEDVILSTAGIAEPGKDIYIYACAALEGYEPIYVLSQNSTVPEGYNADNSRKIGGFHCLCADVGTIEGHPLSGYVAGDILPASVWDLKHRPTSDPEGMAYDEGTGKWYDIYLASWDGVKLVSEYGGAVVTGTTATPFHGLKFREYMGKIGKRLLWRHEFMCVAKGSNECTAIEGAANPVTTGGHVDSEGRRMISDIGLEDCCGCFWQWVNDEYEHLIYASVNSQAGTTDASTGMISRYYTGNNNTSNKYFSGYIWSTDSAIGAETPPATYNDTIDDQQYGDSYGLPRQARAGARWGDSSRCGSRALLASDFGSCAASGNGARGASEPRVA